MGMFALERGEGGREPCGSRRRGLGCQDCAKEGVEVTGHLAPRGSAEAPSLLAQHLHHTARLLRGPRLLHDGAHHVLL